MVVMGTLGQGRLPLGLKIWRKGEGEPSDVSGEVVALGTSLGAAS
jgi:hypothetical protein